MPGSHDVQQMMRVRPDSLDIIPAKVLQPDGDKVNPVSIGRELAAGIEQRLLDLVIGRETDVEIQVEVASPKGDDWFEGLSGERGADAESE